MNSCGIGGPRIVWDDQEIAHCWQVGPLRWEDRLTLISSSKHGDTVRR